MIEASPSAYHSGMLALGKTLTHSRGGDLRRFYTTQHSFYCGIDLHARTMYVCIVNQDGEILVHRTMKAGPDPFLKPLRPIVRISSSVSNGVHLVLAGEPVSREGIPFVLGHALYVKAIHGGKAKNDRIDSQKIAVLLVAGCSLRPMSIPRRCGPRGTSSGAGCISAKRAELLSHVQQYQQSVQPA